MSYIEYIKSKNEKDRPSTTKVVASLMNSYGKVRCDMCDELCDVNSIGSETCTVTEPSTGNKRYYHFCYDCLHRKMDVNDIYGTYTEAVTKQWRKKYKDIKTKTPKNNYEDMCFNCFCTVNDIHMYLSDSPSIKDDHHKAYIAVDIGMDKCSATSPKDDMFGNYNEHGACEVTEIHYTFTLRRHPNGPTDTLKVCKGNGSMLCENCRFKKEDD